MKRCYHVVASPIRIVVNNFGDYNPNGMMYVLKENEKKGEGTCSKESLYNR